MSADNGGGVDRSPHIPWDSNSSFSVGGICGVCQVTAFLQLRFPAKAMVKALAESSLWQMVSRKMMVVVVHL